MFCVLFVLFSSPKYAQFWVFGGTCVSLSTCHCHSVGFCIEIWVILVSQFKMRLVFQLQSTSVHQFSGSCVEFLKYVLLFGQKSSILI